MVDILNLDNVLADFSDEVKKNVLLIHSLSLIPKPKVAFHANDADGVISAVILKTLEEFQHAVFIPLRYQEIRHPELGKFLQSLNWVAIVDLPPFAKSTLDLYCDHHFTNKQLDKDAKVILFDESAPSSAFLLFNHYKHQLSDHLRLLAELTAITDTAGFTIPPPDSIPINFLDVTHQEQAWLLNDICCTPKTTEEVLTLLQDFLNQKLDVFNDKLYQQKIMSLRTHRKASIKIGEQFEVAEVVIIVMGQVNIMISALVHDLLQKGVKITCVLFPGKQFTGISLRVSSNVPASELERYRVDNIVNEFSGGGHPRAAGGRGSTLQVTLSRIIEWIQEQDFSYKKYDLRKIKV